jgi:hypothetical protein
MGDAVGPVVGAGVEANVGTAVAAAVGVGCADAAAGVADVAGVAEAAIWDATGPPSRPV